MTDTSVSQAATTVTAPVAPPANSGNGAFFASLVAVLALAVAGYLLYDKFYGQVATVQGFYVLDFQRLLDSKMAQVMETGSADPQGDAKRMMSELNAVLQDYGQNGMLVLKKELVMSVAADQDITAAVAAKLGIDLNRTLQQTASRMLDRSLNRAGSAAAGGASAGGVPNGMPGMPAATPGAPPATAPRSGGDPYGGMPPEMRELFAPPKGERP